MFHYGHCQEESEHPGGVHHPEESKADNGVNEIKHFWLAYRQSNFYLSMMFLKSEIQALNTGFKFTCYYLAVFFQLYNMSIKIHLGSSWPKYFGNQKSLCFSCDWLSSLFLPLSFMLLYFQVVLISVSLVNAASGWTTQQEEIKSNEMSIMVWSVQGFKKILIAGAGRYPSMLKLVLLSMMNFALHISASGQQGGGTTLCRSLLVAVIGRKVHLNWCLVTQQDFGVKSPKGFSSCSKSLFRYSDSPYREGQVTQEKRYRREGMQGGNLGLWKSRCTSIFPTLFPGCLSTSLPHCQTRELWGLQLARRRRAFSPCFFEGQLGTEGWLPPECTGCTESCFQQAGQDLPLNCFFKGANWRLWAMLWLCMLWFRED